MSRTVPDATRELLLSFPQTEEVSSHGSPAFKVAGKTFAHFAFNHHGDGRAALWLCVPPGLQSGFVKMNSRAYFAPPYVGPKGWLGLDLNAGLSWNEVIARVTEAWTHNAPPGISSQDSLSSNIAAPDTPMSPEDINPLLGKYPQQVLAKLSERCHRLPETSVDDIQSNAAWRAGKKVFARGHHRDGRMKLMFWTGIEQQAFLIEDPRYSIPLYYGNNGWTELDVQDGAYWDEIDSLLENSYRHFALKRMLKKLGDQQPL